MFAHFANQSINQPTNQPTDEVQSELVTATEIKQLFLDNLTKQDEDSIHCDVIAAATRSPSVELAVLAILFHTGLHALVCYRVGHRLWKADRRGLAKYLQSTVSGHYSADIHPACSMGQGIYLCTAAGVGKQKRDCCLECCTSTSSTSSSAIAFFCDACEQNQQLF